MFSRDVRRILAVPRSLIIVVGVLLTPALYSWFNILAFWNPYLETGQLPIAVVNNDEGATSTLTGEINAGDRITAQLERHDQLGWKFLSEDEATDKLSRGELYATFVIPASFSEDLVGIFSGERDQPTIDYYVNEKKGAIAPKITDAGASALDIEITSAFREQVGQAIVQALRDSGIDFDERVTGAEGSAQDALQGIGTDLADAQGSLDSASASLDDSSQTLVDVCNAVAAADPVLADMSAALADARGLLDTVVADAQAFAAAAGQASTAAQQALGESSAAAVTAITTVTGRLDEVQTGLQSTTERLADVLDAVRDRMTALESLPGVDRAVADLTTRLDAVRGFVDQVRQAGIDASTVASDIDALTQSFDDALAAAEDVAGATRDQAAEAVSVLTSQVTALSSALGELTSTVDTTRTSLTQITSLVDGLDEQIASTQGVLAQAKGNVSGLADSVRTAQADVAALASALQSGTLETIMGLDAVNIGQYLASPVEFDQQALYTVTSYGSGMAAMFINLSLWIGAFMLIIIFRVEVDTEGFAALALRSAYLGRFILLGRLAMAQGLIVSIGSLLIGVQPANPAAFVATAAIIGPCYLAIIYALAAALSHVGRTLAVVLIVLQIPGASGIYPIELMPGFFRGLYPLLPFSYGIDAMRETIGGFYGHHYARLMGVLLVMSAVALVAGFIGRRHLAYFTGLFYEDLGRTELVAHENVEVRRTGYRLSHVIALLSNRREFAATLARRQETFDARYPTIVRSLTALGIAGVIVLAIVARATTISKPGLLAVAMIWGLLIIGALIATEGLKRSLVHADELSRLDEDEIFTSLAENNRDLVAAGVPVAARARHRREPDDGESAGGEG